MRAHRTDGVSLTFALIFFGVVAAWLVSTVAGVELPQAGWLIATALIFFGVVGLVGTWRIGRGRGESHPPNGDR